MQASQGLFRNRRKELLKIQQSFGRRRRPTLFKPTSEHALLCFFKNSGKEEKAIGFFKKLFSGAAGKGDKPSAVIFVDYEHWFISMDKLHHMRPDIKGWRDEMAKNYNIKEILFFADFSNSSIRLEIPKIREVSNSIIETQNTSTHHKKDFTDFILLDHVYQKAFDKDSADTFIIFSGDGHFSSAVSFLITKCGKTVGVYAVKDAVSTQLKNTASWVVELPEESKTESYYRDMILRNLNYLRKNSRGKKLRPTFLATVDAVAKYNNVDKKPVTEALRNLIGKRYIIQVEDKISATKSVKILSVDWKKLKRDGIWTE